MRNLIFYYIFTQACLPMALLNTSLGLLIGIIGLNALEISIANSWDLSVIGFWDGNGQLRFLGMLSIGKNASLFGSW